MRLNGVADLSLTSSSFENYDVALCCEVCIDANIDEATFSNASVVFSKSKTMHVANSTLSGWISKDSDKPNVCGALNMFPDSTDKVELHVKSTKFLNADGAICVPKFDANNVLEFVATVHNVTVSNCNNFLSVKRDGRSLFRIDSFIVTQVNVVGCAAPCVDIDNVSGNFAFEECRFADSKPNKNSSEAAVVTFAASVALNMRDIDFVNSSALALRTRYESDGLHKRPLALSRIRLSRHGGLDLECSARVQASNLQLDLVTSPVAFQISNHSLVDSGFDDDNFRVLLNNISIANSAGTFIPLKPSIFHSNSLFFFEKELRCRLHVSTTLF